VLEAGRYAGQVYPTTQSDRKKAILIGLLIPMLFILIKQLLDNKINGADDVERITRLPLIGHILHNTKDGSNVVTLYPKSIIAETFRRVRTRLEYMNGEVETPIIAISSSMPGEGKTFCALNMASVFAISGKKTVLVGFDMRKPGLNKVFDLNNHKGLSQYLIGKATIEEIIQPGPQENFFVIASGSIPPNPSELIGSHRTLALFEELKKDFDIILLDTPPMGIVTDGFLLARHANSLVFLTRQGYTVKEIFIQTIRQMNDEGIKNIGILVNDINAKKGILGYRYNYGYGYGYGYGNGYGQGYYEG
jgi:capsular exopolysaccharide synthesis family protein